MTKIKRVWVLAGLSLLTAAIAGAQLRTPNVKAPDQADGVVITVTRFGPYPTVIQHATGSLTLFVVNRSGVLEDAYSLRVKPASQSDLHAPPLLDLHSTKVKRRDHVLVNLPPGSYQLLFGSHPDWVVDITITPN